MSTYKEKLDRVKKWSRDHEDALIFGGLVTFVVVIGYVSVKAEMADTERQTAELNYYIDQLNDVNKQLDLMQSYNLVEEAAA